MDIVLDRHRPGQENMAIDTALLEQGDPVVRLYGWDPGCVSLGYTQDREDVNLEAIEAHGFDVVERPTGGGAILHLPSEVTYCVVLPTDWHGLPGELFEDYRYMSRGVLAVLDKENLDPTYKQATGGKDAFCYLREAGVSIVVDGRKVSGGAQRRTKAAVLQHGTVLVESDAELLAEIFDEDADRVAEGVGSLQALGVPLDRDELIDNLAGAFLATLGVEDPTILGPGAMDRLVDRIEA